MMVKYRVENQVRNDDQIIKDQNDGQITGQNHGQITGQGESTTHTNKAVISTVILHCEFTPGFYTGNYTVILHPCL